MINIISIVFSLIAIATAVFILSRLVLFVIEIQRTIRADAACESARNVE